MITPSPLSPAEAVELMRSRCAVMSAETTPLSEAASRVLAGPLIADRDHPPVSVSAMDGFAVRAAEVAPGPMEVGGESRIGHPPPTTPRGCCVKVMTGGAVPDDADAVIKREDVGEEPGRIVVPDGLVVRAGEHVRRGGENARRGDPIAPPGSLISPALMGALATFGVTQVPVHRRVRVAILATGDEIQPVEALPTPWQIRDSNSWALQGLLRPQPWIDLVSIQRFSDDASILRQAAHEALDRADALLMTGGVSMGDLDFAPAVLRDAGVEVLFHRLPQRPGRPMLGGVGPRGQVVFGLPGNPLSVMVTARRIALPVLAHSAGIGPPRSADPAIRLELTSWRGGSLGLWWHRPVQIRADGTGQLLEVKGSHDVAGAAESDGFVEIPPGAEGSGPWMFRAWRF
ncbi:MAG: molybdopterin molybdotransferase MoeA [Phycisphaeraceae bacterium]|nr:molybdopterin molybdotransferase MoeA [Phycisphaeraceae bacterium]